MINTGQAIAIARKQQLAKGTAASGGGGKGLLIAPSPGLQLQQTYIENPQIRNDGMTALGPNGSRHSAGSYEVPFSIGQMDDLMEAGFRGTLTDGVLLNGIIERYFTFDEHRQLSDKSKIFEDVKVTGLTFSAQADQVIMMTVRAMGLEVNSSADGSAPSLTAPVYVQTVPLSMKGGTITINGVVYDVLTGLSWDLDLGGEAPAVLSSVSPDVFLANARLTGSFTAMSQDLVFFDAFKAGTIGNILIEIEEEDGDGACSFEIPAVKFTGNDTPFGGSGPMPETVPWTAGRGTTEDDEITMIKYVTNAEPVS